LEYYCNKRIIKRKIRQSKKMDKTIFTPGHKELVAKLIKARKEARLRQADAARKMGHTQSYISKIEAGQRRIDTVQLKELAAVYKKNISYFIR